MPLPCAPNPSTTISSVESHASSARSSPLPLHSHGESAASSRAFTAAAKEETVSAASITPNIERAVPKPHEAAASQARKVLEEPPPKLGASKRVFLNLNGWSDPGVKQYLEEHGCELVELRGFAGQARGTAALARVKALIREGRAIWLNIRVGKAHGHNPRWVSQCCRMAHRAGVPWTVRFTMSQPWRIQQ